MKKKPYSNMDAATAIAVSTDKALLAKIVRKQRRLDAQHQAAIDHLPADKPAATPHKAPVDSSRRKVVRQIRRGCCGFTYTNFNNR